MASLAVHPCFGTASLSGGETITGTGRAPGECPSLRVAPPFGPALVAGAKDCLAPCSVSSPGCGGAAAAEAKPTPTGLRQTTATGSCHTRAHGNPRRRRTSALSPCASADSSLLSLAGQKTKVQWRVFRTDESSVAHLSKDRWCMACEDVRNQRVICVTRCVFSGVPHGACAMAPHDRLHFFQQQFNNSCIIDECKKPKSSDRFRPWPMKRACAFSAPW